MPVHDWSGVAHGIFHAFHFRWVGAIDDALNSGLLPADFYSLPEQTTSGPGNPDVLTLRLALPGAPPAPTPDGGAPSVDRGGTTKTATAPPRVQFHDQTDASAYARRAKSVVIRHAASGDRVVAVVEVISPGNKSSHHAIRALAEKAADFLDLGVHLLLLDLFPPGPRDPQGIHPLIWSEFKTTDFELPPGKPLTLAAYAAGPVKDAFIEPVAVGGRLPDMPLFLTPDEYVNIPLEATYQAAWAKIPGRWRAAIERPVP